MKSFLLLIAFALCMYPMQAETSRNVVRISVTNTQVVTWQPWQPLLPQECSGTGFVIEGNRILTNAHVVNFATFIQIMKDGAAKKYTAHVEHISHQVDLALLRVDDESFFEGTVPVTFGELPTIQDRITVIGFPEFGLDISYTSGIVSRIEVQSYAHSKQNFLAIQVDAAINPGNSGGPAFIDGKVVGIAMQTIQNSQNLGYLIPVSLILHFLADAKDGHVDGFPQATFLYENMENQMLREYYGLDASDDKGVLVVGTNFEETAPSAIQPDDVILAINGQPVFSNGKYLLREGTLVEIAHLLSMMHVGETIDFGILRKAKKLRVTQKAAPFTPLVPYTNTAMHPPYFVYGGFVFVTHNKDYYSYYGTNPIPPFLQCYDRESRSSIRREIVFLHSVLSHDANSGYWSQDIVESINGLPVVSLVDMSANIEKADRWVKLKMKSQYVIVIDKRKAEAVSDEIMKTYQVPAAHSAW